MTSRSRFRPWALLAGAALLLPSVRAAAQTPATVRVEENFRRTPNGDVLARLDPGTPLTVVGRDGRWREVVVEGWIWTRSLQIVDREGMNLVVAADGGENLRATPSGEVLGRLEEGALLDELERRPGWIRARRQGWIWGPSVVETEAPASGPEETGATPAPVSSRRPTGVARSGTEGASILGSPDGDTLATTLPGTEMEVTARQGSWARVRIEGWTWLPDDGEAASAGSDGGGPLTPAELVADPSAYRGRVVNWSLQFISLEAAERVRTDFFEGEPFLLTRYGGPDGPFVYVAVPRERLDQVRGLTPLERLTVTGRVRTGASALTGTPIVDLMTLARGGGGP